MDKVNKWTFRQICPACLKLTFTSVLFFPWQHQVMFTVVTIRQTDCLACLFDIDLKKTTSIWHGAGIGLNLVPPLSRVGTRSAGEETELISRLCLSQ